MKRKVVSSLGVWNVACKIDVNSSAMAARPRLVAIVIEIPVATGVFANQTPYFLVTAAFAIIG